MSWKRRLASVIIGFGAVMCAAGVSAAEPEAISLKSRDEYLSEWNSEAMVQLCEYKYTVVKLSDRDVLKYPELAEALEKRNEGLKADFEKTFEEAIPEAKEQYEERKELFGPFTREELGFVQRADTSAVSVLYTFYEFRGGAHGYTDFYPWNYDTKSGKVLELDDVTTDRAALVELLKEALKTEYPDMDWSEEKDALAVDADFHWSLGYKGINFYFGSYVLGSYADGPQIVTVPFAGNEAIFVPEYIEVPASYGVEMSSMVPLYEDIDGDGSLEKLMYWGDNYEYDAWQTVTVMEGDRQGSVDLNNAYYLGCTLMKSGGESYIYAETMSDNDYFSITVIKLGPDGPEKAGEIGAGRSYEGMAGEYPWLRLVLTDPENFDLDMRTWILSTLNITANYRMGADGMPEKKGTGDWYDYNNKRELTLKQDHTFPVVDNEGNEVGTADLAAGTKIRLLRTDDKSYGDASLDDGRIIRIYIGSKEWPYSVDGVSQDDLFDGMLYAG